MLMLFTSQNNKCLFFQPKRRERTLLSLIWMELFAGTVPANNTLFAGTVPENNTLFAGTVPENNTLFAGTANPGGGLKLKFHLGD